MYPNSHKVSPQSINLIHFTHFPILLYPSATSSGILTSWPFILRHRKIKSLPRLDGQTHDKCDSIAGS